MSKREDEDAALAEALGTLFAVGMLAAVLRRPKKFLKLTRDLREQAQLLVDALQKGEGDEESS